MLHGGSRELRLIVWLAAGIGAVYFLTFREGTTWGDDFAQYIQHAANIASGRPYDALPYDYEPRLGSPRVYPPGFPLLLAAPYAIFGLSLTPMKVLVTGLFLVALVLLFTATRHDLSLRSRICLLAIVAANPYFWDFKDEVLSDWPFLAAVVAALVGIAHVARGEPARRWRTGLLLGAGMGAAIALRGAGIALLPVAVISVLLARRRIPAPVLAGIGLALLLAGLIFVATPGLRTYGEITDKGVERLAASIEFYAKCLALLWDNGYSVGLRAALFALTSALAFVGLLTRLRPAPGAWELFVPFYMGLLIIYGGWGGFRFLMPVVPAYLIWVFTGIERVGRYRGARFETTLVALLLVAVAATYGARYTRVDLRGPLATAEPEIVELWDFVRTETPPDAVIQFQRLRASTLFTGRRGSAYVPGETDAEVWERLGRAGTTHLTLGPTDGEYWSGFIGRHGRCLRRVFGNSRAQVFAIEPAAELRALGCGTDGRTDR